jgi:hypothetical protein
MAEKSTYTQLTKGWVASVNLSNAQKFDILLRLAALALLPYPQDWEWTVPGATALLADKQAASETSRRSIASLGSDVSERIFAIRLGLDKPILGLPEYRVIKRANPLQRARM